MDNATNLILDYSLIQATETGRSVTMETEGLRRCLTHVLDSGVQVLSIATDLMKKTYPYIEHQYDMWHLTKGVTKQLTKHGKAKHCEKLLPWIHSISNHFWWCAQTFNSVSQATEERIAADRARFPAAMPLTIGCDFQCRSCPSGQGPAQPTISLR